MRRFWGVVTDCVLQSAITLMLPFVILLLGLPTAGVVKLSSAAFAVAVGQGSYWVSGNGSSSSEMSGARTR
jgi:hypothetical protein